MAGHLLRAGQRVRALTGNPARATLPAEVEVVAGYLTDPGTANVPMALIDEVDVCTVAEARECRRAQGPGDELIDLFAAWRGNPPPEARTPNTAVEYLTGRPPGTLARWVSRPAASFP